MFNIKKIGSLVLALIMLCSPSSAFADETSEEFGGKTDGDFIFFEEVSELESIDLAIEIFKSEMIVEEEIKKEEKKEEKKEILGKEASNIINYIMKKNYRLSKEEAQKIYDSVINYCNTYKVDPYLVFAIMEQESTFNPKTSYKGAYGLMQIYYTTFPYLGITMEEVYDIDKNIRAGVKEISGNITMFGDYTTALSAYNWGSGNVKRGTYNTKYANSVLKRKANIESIVKVK